MFMMELCKECAESIYGSRKPTKEYSERVADLLFGTGAAESEYTYRRQTGFTLRESRGGWGLWQMQSNALEDCFKILRLHDLIRVRVDKFLGFQTEAIVLIPPMEAVKILYGHDKFAIAMARVYYFLEPTPVPKEHEQRAEYYVKYYNRGGKANVRKYLEAYKRCLS